MVSKKMVIRFVCYLANVVFKSSHNRFIADFKKNVLKGKPDNSFQNVRNCRERLSLDRSKFDGEGCGAGSRVSEYTITIAEKAEKISVNHPTGMLLYKLANYYQPETIIELGTAFGISTLYLAEGNPDSEIITIEGNNVLADIAKAHFSLYKKSNIRLIQGDFDDLLECLIEKVNKNTLVFIDGNHTCDSTLKYFRRFAEKARIIVLDDITWSEDMIRAWQIICKENSGTIIDLFKTGIVFPGAERQNCSLWY